MDREAFWDLKTDEQIARLKQTTPNAIKPFLQKKKGP